MAGNERRILLLGKTGVGKSSTGNTILGKRVFEKVTSPSSSVQNEAVQEKYIKGKMIKVIDTPGFFGTDEVEKDNTDGTDSPDDQKSEMARGIVECSLGPHAVVIVLRVERYTKQEEKTVELITDIFSEDVFKYAVVLFTHGYDLKGVTIEEFVTENDKLQKLIDRCGGRCHVIDNEHWKHWLIGNKSNKTQVRRLLNTIENLLKQNGGQYYTNEFLKAVDTAVHKEEEHMEKENKGNLSEKEIKKQAKDKVRFEIIAAGCATGVLLGALLGIPVLVGAGVYHFSKELKEILLTLSKTSITAVLGGAAGVGVLGAGAGAAGAGAAGAAGAGAVGAGAAGATAALGSTAVEATAVAAGAGAVSEAGAAATVGAAGAGGAISVGVAAGIAAGVVGGVMIAAGAVAGGVIGAKAAKGADSPGEAAEMAKDAVIDGVKKLFCKDTSYKKLY